MPASIAEGVATLFSTRHDRGDWLGGLFDLDVDDELFGADAETEAWETVSLALHRVQPAANLLAEDRLNAEQEARRSFLLEAKSWGSAGWLIQFVLPRESEEKRVREILAEDKIKLPKAVWSRGSLDEGCKLGRAAGRGPSWAALPEDCPGVVLVSETEVFGRHRLRRAPARRRATVQTSQVDQMLDFADLEYLSSAGLRVLVATQKRVTAAEGTLRIVNASDDIREVFDITGLIDVFDVE